MQHRYHIQFNNRRTTITLDKILSELLALKLGLSPDDKQTHGLVRQWLEITIIDRLGDNLPTGSRVSQWARYFAIEEIADKKLKSARQDWLITKDSV